MPYRIAVIGLGLMGGSLAYALKGFRGAEIVGADRDHLTRERAVSAGAVARAYANAAEAVKDASLVVFCIYPRHIPELMRACAPHFLPGAVVSDICGSKARLYEKLTPLLPENIDYVGIHPMAGKERDGFDNADPALFRNTGFLITPLPRTSPSGVELMRELASYIGASRIAVSPPEQHDEIIAYTSDLMHMAAAGLCADFQPGMSMAYTAGAFRDCTRIADINAGAWCELLFANRENALIELDRYMENLSWIREALVHHDHMSLTDLFEKAGRNKREMLKR